MIEQISSLFIVGYMHSGTTLLKNILGNHPDVFSGIGELKIFEFLPEISKYNKNPESIKELKQFIIYLSYILCNGYRINSRKLEWTSTIFEESDLDKLVLKCQGKIPEEMIKPIADRITILNRKKHWLEKTPTHVFYIDKIMSVIPEAKFIEVVRDPRSVLASKKIRRQTVFSDRYPTSQQYYKNLEKAYDPIWDLLSWKSAILAGEKARERYPESIVRIKYEDLVMNPEKNILAVCDHIGIDFSPEMLRIETDNSAYTKKEREGVGIFSDSIDRWKSFLTPTEMFIVNVLAKQELVSIDYIESQIRSVSFFSVMKIIYSSGRNLN